MGDSVERIGITKDGGGVGTGESVGPRLTVGSFVGDDVGPCVGEDVDSQGGLPGKSPGQTGERIWSLAGSVTPKYLETALTNMG